MSSAADHNLLFGILALQMDFVSREQLISAVSIWVLEKATPLGAILVRQQALADDRRTLLEALVTEHLKQHGNDPEKSLAAVSSVGSVRDQLNQLADPEIDATLVNVSRTRGCADSLETVSVGKSTSGGLRFRVLRPHAKGGLGEVFVANDEELRREVALKQIQTHHADDPNSRSRFLLEAEITGGLEHPGIVPVYGLGTYADGRPFYAMRFIRGDSLKDAIEQFHAADSAKLSPGERTIEFHKLLRRFIDVCNAIDYAHSRGVLHRDLKPGNIMLGKYGETLVVDWGLAKAVGRSESATAGSGEMTLKPISASGSAPTQMGSAIGTPQYMSPEQAAGRLDQLGPHSDVYSLGATLYCLLTGKAPLSDRSADGIGEILRRVQQGEITPPRQLLTPISDSRFEIPKPLEAICLKAMAVNPADRYPSPRALADDLEHWLADEPISAQRDSLSRRVARWTRRHRALAQSAAAAIALVAAVAIGAVVLINQARRTADDERQIAQQLAEEKARLAEKEARARQQADALATSERQARERADQQTQLALKTLNSVVFDIEYKLDGVAGAGDIRRDLLNTAIAGLRQVARTLETSTTADHALIASHLELGQTFLDLGGGKGIATDEALKQFQAAHELAQKLVQADPKNAKAQRDLSISYSRLGNVNLQLGHVAAARDAYQQGLEISQKLAQADPKNAEAQRDLSISHIKLGNVNLELGNVAAARDAYQQASEFRQKLAQADPKNAEAQRDLAGSYERLGTVNLKLGNVPAARDAYQQGLEISQKLARADPLNAEAQRNLSMFFEKLGNVSLQLGSVQSARDAYRHELEIGQKLAAADPKNAEAQRDLWVSYNKLGDVNLQLGNAPAARDAYQQGLEISRKLALADPKNALAKRDLALSYEYLGTVNLQLGDAPGARDAYQQALEFRQKLALADPKNAQAQRDLSISYENLGDVSLQLGTVPAARDAYQHAFDIREKLAQADPKNAQAQRDLSVSYNKLGNVNLQLDNVAGARDAYQQGLEIFQKLAQADPKNAEAQRDLSVSYDKLGAVHLQLDNVADARDAYQQGLEIRQKLAQADPKSTQVQRDLSVSYINLGDIDLLHNLSAARNAYRQGLEIRQKLAQADPENARAQCDLAYNFGKLGTVEMGAQDFSAAVRWLKRGIGILEQLDRDGKITGQPLYQGWLKDQREQLVVAEASAEKGKTDEKP